MTLSRYPEDIRLHIDANSKTFTFEQTPDEREPLSSLTARLESLSAEGVSLRGAVQSLERA